jgi:hypothetical protein
MESYFTCRCLATTALRRNMSHCLLFKPIRPEWPNDVSPSDYVATCLLVTFFRGSILAAIVLQPLPLLPP